VPGTVTKLSRPERGDVLARVEEVPERDHLPRVVERPQVELVVLEAAAG
jgi:hypothetical protein